jgi:soluble lytic murein transglycosylase-like protein
MKRLAAVAVVALALAGSASADVFSRALGLADVSGLPAERRGAEHAGRDLFPPSLLQRPDFVEERGYDELLALWQRDGALYSVPWQVLAAINKVESNFGRNMGPSSAGAIGWMQFMPSTWERWGVDADGDGLANPWSAEDAIAAAARYLAASVARAISRGPSSPTTTRSGTSTRCSSSPSSSAPAEWTRPLTSTGCRSRSTRTGRPSSTPTGSC